MVHYCINENQYSKVTCLEPSFTDQLEGDSTLWLNHRINIEQHTSDWKNYSDLVRERMVFECSDLQKEVHNYI
jgi:hypothetical protein